MAHEGRPADRPPRVKPVVRINNFVRKQTQAVDLETLNQQGITRINFLTFTKLNELISLGVQKAFEKYQRTWDQVEARVIEDVARAELREMLPPSLAPVPAAAAPPAPAGVPAEIELLERRIEKLKRQLAETEETLRRLSQAAEMDPGVPSFFREVQGLAPSDPQNEKKREMLKIIFEENLGIQKAGRL